MYIYIYPHKGNMTKTTKHLINNEDFYSVLTKRYYIVVYTTYGKTKKTYKY